MQGEPWRRSAVAHAPTSPTQTDLERLARRLGVRVGTARLEPGLLGLYDSRRARIWLASVLTPVERRCVLAHELGHVHHGHRSSTPAAERAADAYAARLLVDPIAFREACRWTQQPVELADELDLTEDVVRAYLTNAASWLPAAAWLDAMQPGASPGQA